MSAAITWHGTDRMPIDKTRDSAELLCNIPQLAENGMELRADIPGQLWERVAETSEKSFRYVWRGGMPRGPLVANGWQVDAHGIIHAGVRVK